MCTAHLLHKYNKNLQKAQYIHQDYRYLTTKNV